MWESPPPEPMLIVEKVGAIAYFVINRPKVHNVLSWELRGAIGAAVAAFEEDEALRVGVLTAAGTRAFSAGGDIRNHSERAATGLLGRGVNIEIPRPGLRGFSVLDECRKPLIAAIDGFCLAGGFELAMLCDIRIATEKSTFGMPEPRNGIIGGPGLHELSRLIPLGEALLIQLTGAHVQATRMHQVGLVQELAHTRAELFEVVDRIAGEIAICSPAAVSTIKHIVRQTRALPLDVAWTMAEPYQERIARSSDAAEGIRAFLEKREPVWQTGSGE